VFEFAGGRLVAGAGGVCHGKAEGFFKEVGVGDLHEGPAEVDRAIAEGEVDAGRADVFWAHVGVGALHRDEVREYDG